MIRQSIKTLMALALCLPLLVSCASSTTASIPVGCEQASSPCLQGKASVELTTSKGSITLELNGDAAPVTAGNFLDLVQRGAYNGTVFHRVVRDPVPFVVQGGDPSSSDPATPKSQYGTGSFVDPTSGQARFVPLELSFNGEDQPRYGRVVSNPTELVQLKLSHERGALAMARSQAPDSASAQFYIALKPLPELDGRYAVFGRVTQGLDVVDAIRQDDTIEKAVVLTPGL
ncbi:cyclophilin type peptidyl-prolyl cis-trans isomerase/CLD family protein [Synechococcus sp. MIT S9220]|uniref:peptidylprolyl isomerase n=1 Tax=unclassified Synechococcus TaxID=2626047 RepID=UPI00164B911D|nr:peptidylprolyl isomerase [Synechococcus sp. MIT S9220]NOL47422.1 peptidylprolyl isomerase [Synechococcus sp. MIT S9220]QNJ22247.1 cyclophilin type peptidyl-prolyl cis-trans isomerase/CLD family protein [Synechococcus sp. MIT S9220]